MAAADLVKLWPTKVFTASFLSPVAEGLLVWVTEMIGNSSAEMDLSAFFKKQPMCFCSLSGACEHSACVWDSWALSGGPLSAAMYGKAAAALLLPPERGAGSVPRLRLHFSAFYISTALLGLGLLRARPQPAACTLSCVRLSVHTSVEDWGFRLKRWPVCRVLSVMNGEEYFRNLGVDWGGKICIL